MIKLSESQKKAAKMYADKDNSLSFIASACGIGHEAIYAAIKALGIPKRTSAVRSRRSRIAARRADFHP